MTDNDETARENASLGLQQLDPAWNVSAETKQWLVDRLKPVKEKS
jgi:hypothetical protein